MANVPSGPLFHLHDQGSGTNIRMKEFMHLRELKRVFYGSIVSAPGSPFPDRYLFMTMSSGRRVHKQKTCTDARGTLYPAGVPGP
jgi:hypothetical protein